MAPDASLSPETAALERWLRARPGALAEPVTASRGSVPLALMFKVMGKMFAILSVRGTPSVILKCDPHLAEVLRGRYAAVGHRSHLDRRFWIAVDLEGDVPREEIERLAAQSYDLVCGGLSRKQKAELLALLREGAS